MEPFGGFASPPPGCPAHGSGSAQPLYGPEFAADPEGVYARLREYGPAAPVELAPGVTATLVTEYTMALKVLQSPDTFAKDSRRWTAFAAGEVPMDSPVVPMMAYRPNCLFTDGAAHMRLRQAVTDALARIDSLRLSRNVERVCAYLVGQFGERGHADLLAEYAKPLPLLVFNELFGCPADIGDRLVNAMSAFFDGVNPEKANAEMTQGLVELVGLKRSRPGDDVTSWLMQHSSRLTDEEMIHQLVVLLGAGMEPQTNVIAGGLQLILAEDQASGGPHGAGLLVEDAIDTVLWNSPPIANYAPHYPVQDVELAGVRFKAGEPVLISFAAANTDPALSQSRQILSKRAHLAWGAGPHACPAKDPAQLISILAIEKLLNHLPDAELAVPVETLTWRPGPFHRALNSLPARFTPVRAVKPSTSASWQEKTAAVTPAAHPAEKAAAKGSWWSSFLSWWRV